MPVVVDSLGHLLVVDRQHLALKNLSRFLVLVGVFLGSGSSGLGAGGGSDGAVVRALAGYD